MDRASLAARVAEVATLHGSFTLRSGQTSDTYFDKYQFESDPTLLAEIGRQLGELVPDRVDALAGLELGGVPVATALALQAGLPMVFVRKQAKEYGTAKLAEGPEIDGRRLLIVEDVVTSGGQIVESVGALRERGAVIDTAVCVLDREQGGASNLASIGVELRPLLLRRDLE